MHRFIIVAALVATVSACSPSAPTPVSMGVTPTIRASIATPAPTAPPTAGPTGTSSPIVTPEPIITPTPEPVITPKPTPVPPIFKTAGRGDKVVRFAAQDAPTIARITGKGSGTIAVASYAGAVWGGLLVDEIGSYAGSVYVAAGANRFVVSSSGSWTIEIYPISSARLWDGVAALTGRGDTVVMLTGGAAGRVTIKNKGRTNFAVAAYTPEGVYLDILVNAIGSHSGEVLLPDADPMILVVSAAGGTWSLSAVAP